MRFGKSLVVAASCAVLTGCTTTVTTWHDLAQSGEEQLPAGSITDGASDDAGRFILGPKVPRMLTSSQAVEETEAWVPPETAAP